MPYQPRPNSSGDTLVASRDQIRTNFEITQTDFEVNHVAFDASGEGKHKFMQMPEQGSAPTTAANEGALYAAVGTGPAESNLFFKEEGDNNSYQMTRVDNSLFARFGTNTNYQVGPPLLTGGWTFLPGGLVMNYGSHVNLSGGSASTVVVTFAKPFTTAVYTVVAFAEGPNTNAAVASLLTSVPSTTAFSARLASNVTKFYWHAIGL